MQIASSASASCEKIAQVEDNASVASAERNFFFFILKAISGDGDLIFIRMRNIVWNLFFFPSLFL